MICFNYETIPVSTVFVETLAVLGYAWIKAFTVCNGAWLFLKAINERPKVSPAVEERVLSKRYLFLLSADLFLRIIVVLNDLAICVKGDRTPTQDNAESLLALWHVLETRRLSLDFLTSASMFFVCLWRVKQSCAVVWARRQAQMTNVYDITESACVAAAWLVQARKEREARDEVLLLLGGQPTVAPWREAAMLAQLHQLIFLHLVQLALSSLTLAVALSDTKRHAWRILTVDAASGNDADESLARAPVKAPVVEKPAAFIPKVEKKVVPKKKVEAVGADVMRGYVPVPGVGLADAFPVAMVIAVCLGLFRR